MDALREQCEGGFKMSAYKDKTQGTWYVSFRYIDCGKAEDGLITTPNSQRMLVNAPYQVP